MYGVIKALEHNTLPNCDMEGGEKGMKPESGIALGKQVREPSAGQNCAGGAQ